MTTHEIPAANIEGAKARIAELAKRAAKIAARGDLNDYTPITLTVGERALRRRADGASEVVYRCTLTGAAPRLAGWSFAAALQHEEAGTIIRSIPGVEVDLTSYRNAPPRCEHCNTTRRRADTYVVVNGTTTRQVGSSCLADFTGHKSPAAAIAIAEILMAADESCEGFGSGGVPTATAAEFLAFVAAQIRVNGWTSRTVARDTGRRATADLAMMSLFPAPDARDSARLMPEAADTELAAVALAWSETAFSGNLSDYEHNLSIALAGGIATHRLAGIIASLIPCYSRAMGLVAERKFAAAAGHVGTVGKRSTFELELVRVFSYDSAYGVTNVHKFRADSGAVVVWKTGSVRLDAGRYAVTATVKAHDEYKGEPQTVLTRAKCAAVSA